MNYHDQKMLRDVARAKQSGNMYQAKTLANELAQARETKKMMQSLRVMIEKTEHRFVAYDGIGDMAVTIEPIIVLMKNLKSSLRGFLPGVAGEVTEMTEMLGSYMSQTQNQIEFNINTSSLTLDVENIMSEAAAVASDSVNARLPSTPAEVNRVTTSNNTI
jgi:division protein CdvB (Snf7/Vps24/ESCRT-III family)